MQAAEALARLGKDIRNLEIHCIGHSAGSIILGHMLTRLTKLKTPVRSVHLYAPACTTEFALEHYKRAVDAGTLARKRLRISILSDQRERGDTVGPYGKSLLYLVSRALEEVHKMPLLGLENAWGADDLSYWNKPMRKHVQDWVAFAGAAPAHVLNDEKVNDGQGLIDTAHGAFDNDIAGLERTIQAMLGAKPRYPVENLRGF